jgi:penicillin amidase
MKRSRFLKWLARIGVALLILVVVSAIAGVWFLRRPWSQTDGTLEVSGLQASVQVIRNDKGVPNIYAENEHDLFFAQGYVHAQDRLWQMEFFRRYGDGTLSEILGKPAIDSDRQARYFGLRRIAEKSWAEMDSDTRAMMEAYADGINAYVNTHRDRLPLEFTILSDNPEPWTPVDTLTWGTVMAYYTQRFNHDYELFRAKVVAELGESAAEDLLPAYAPGTPTILPAGVESYKWLRGVSLQELDTEYVGDLTFWGSGAWVVDGAHTQTGKPMLANDPHLPVWIPSMWYENGLHGGRFDVVGFALPGVPWVMVGHNQHIAWGFANMNPDVEDFYIEKLNDPKDPTQYEYMGKWYDLETITETIKVKGSEPVVLNIHLTRHGPIMNDLFGLSDTPPLAHRWAVADGRQVARAIAQLNIAQNWNEFHAALRYWEAIGQTFLYADVDGNIGLQTAGIVPIRVPKHLGIVPVPGWTDEYEWQGYIPFDEMPSMFNPSSGYLFSANSRVAPDDYPYRISYDWFSPGYRAQRMEKLLKAKVAEGKPFTMDDMRNIQADTYSIPGELLRPYLLALTPENDQQTKSLSYIKSWNLDYDVNSVGAAVFETWVSFMIDNTVNDELGAHGLVNYVGAYPWLKKSPAVTAMMQNPNNAWFDDVNTPAKETRDDIVRRSLSDALAWLTKWYGDDPAKWNWGQMHQVRFNHTPFENAGPMVSSIFSSKTYPAPGSNFSLNLSYGQRGSQSFDIWAGASIRMILDLSDWDAMRAATATGQSGQLFHPNREDQIQDWLAVMCHVSPFSKDAVKAEAAATLTLKPK